MLSQNDLADLPGKAVAGTGGDEIGTIEDVFAYSSTDTPAWAAISIDGALRPLPLVDAELSGEGLTVPYDRDQVAAAPEADPDALTTSRELYDHYGLTDAELRDDTGNPAGESA